MDLSNQANILNLARTDEDRVKVALLRSFDPAADSLEVPDPWGNEIDAYEEVLTMIERSVTGFLARLQ